MDRRTFLKYSLLLLFSGGCAIERIMKQTFFNFILNRGEVVVNPQQKFHYDYYLSQEKAEQSLLRLAREAFWEEIFIYIKEQGLLRETGFAETAFGATDGFYAALQHKEDTVIRYHLHLLVSGYTTLKLTHGDKVGDRDIFNFLMGNRLHPSINDVLSDSFEKFVDEYEELYKEMRDYRVVVVDYSGLIDYTGFRRFLNRKVAAGGVGVYERLREAYKKADYFHSWFLDDACIDELMSRLPLEARFKTTTEGFDMNYEEFQGLIRRFGKSESYRFSVGISKGERTTLKPEFVAVIEKFEEDGRDKSLDNFRKYLDESLGSILK